MTSQQVEKAPVGCTLFESISVFEYNCQNEIDFIYRAFFIAGGLALPEAPASAG